jgi:DNA-binding MarR family transcriptional regulator
VASRRKADPSDERVTILEITTKAKRALKKIESEKDEWLELQLRGLSKAEKLQLLGMIKRLIKHNVQAG